MKNKVFYKIRQKSTGMFSDGKYGIGSKTGKVWKRVGDLHAHFTMNAYMYSDNSDVDIDDLEVVSYEMQEVEVEPLKDRMLKYAFIKKEKNLKSEIGRCKWAIKKSVGDVKINELELYAYQRKLETLYTTGV